MKIKKLIKLIKNYLYPNQIHCDIDSKDFYSKRIKRIDS